MRKRMSLLCLLVVMATGCGITESERLTADSYDEREITLPYGSPLEERDISEQTRSVFEAGEKIVDNVEETTERISHYADTAERVSDTVDSGVQKLDSFAEQARTIIESIELPKAP